MFQNDFFLTVNLLLFRTLFILSNSGKLIFLTLWTKIKK